MTTTIPCRAKDPDTCVYHGAERRAEAALFRGDADTWLRETENMLRNSDIDEVQAFIAAQAPQAPFKPSVTPRAHTLVTHPVTTVVNTDATIAQGLAQAVNTFDDRFAAAIKDINDGEPVTGYIVGGTRADIAAQPNNDLRYAYQRIADDALELGDAPSLYDRRDGATYRIDREALGSRMLVHKQEATYHDNRELADAYEHAYDMLYTWQEDGEGNLPTSTVLKELDNAYWQEAAQQPVPASPATDFDRRFTDAYMNGEGGYRLYGVNQYTHNLTPYQGALVEAVDTISVYTREVDSTDRTYVSKVVTESFGRTDLAGSFEHRAVSARDDETARAYRNVQQLISQLRPDREYPDSIESYTLLESVEELFARSIND